MFSENQVFNLSKVKKCRKSVKILMYNHILYIFWEFSILIDHFQPFTEPSELMLNMRKAQEIQVMENE